MTQTQMILKKLQQILEEDNLLQYNNLIIFNNFTKQEKYYWNIVVIFLSEQMNELIDPHPNRGSICLLVKIYQFLALYCFRSQIGLNFKNGRWSIQGMVVAISPKIVIMFY